MPELPEAERARQKLELVVGREIVAVDDRDTYVCRPHAPGEMAAALVGHRLVEAHRRGKFLWAETDGGPDLGLHLGMAGSLTVDEAPAPRNWDRFSIEFADGGRLALRDKRRLGRAVLEPDFAHVGPDAAEVGRERVPHALRPQRHARQGAAARPGRDRRRRQPAGRRDPLARADEPAPPRERAQPRGARRAPALGPRGGARRDPQRRRPHRPLHPAPRARQATARAAAPSSSGPRSAAARRSGAPPARRYDGPSPTWPGSAASSSSTAVAVSRRQREPALRQRLDQPQAQLAVEHLQVPADPRAVGLDPPVRDERVEVRLQRLLGPRLARRPRVAGTVTGSPPARGRGRSRTARTSSPSSPLGVHARSAVARRGRGRTSAAARASATASSGSSRPVTRKRAAGARAARMPSASSGGSSATRLVAVEQRADLLVRAR